MPDGGFLVKFDGKEMFRCTSIAFNYDMFTYKRDNEEPKHFPQIKGRIEVIFEEMDVNDYYAPSHQKE